MSKEKVKNFGEVFTPPKIVTQILDSINYNGSEIYSKCVIDPSCGDGTFLREVVARYILAGKALNKSSLEIGKSIRSHIFGIDISESNTQLASKRISEQVYKSLNVTGNASILTCDSLIYLNDKKNYYDYIVGNPPYVRIHNLSENEKSIPRHLFSHKGMDDLYLSFIDASLYSLKESGLLGYILPSSWLSSVAGSPFRDFLFRTQPDVQINDLAHYNPFTNATTYTMILVILNTKKAGASDSDVLFKTYSDKIYTHFKYTDILMAGKFIFPAKNMSIDILKKIFGNNGTSSGSIRVKNGYATLADKVFLAKGAQFKNNTINVIKASKGLLTKMIFPYDKDGFPISLDSLDPEVRNYLLMNKAILLKRTTEKGHGWYEYGRTQAIKDTFNQKISVNQIIRTSEDLKLVDSPSGTGVYGGIYILTEQPLSKIASWLMTNEFTTYVQSLRNYKSGGYFAFSSKDLERYLCFKNDQDNSG